MVTTILKNADWLRHTGASMEIERGRALKDVSEDLGHASMATTDTVYVQTENKKRAESGKNKTVDAGNYVKNGAISTATYVKDTTTNTTISAYGMTWGNRGRWQRVVIATTGVTAAAYVINDWYGEEISAILGCDETDEDCEACN